jgi:hypothetical protein
MGSVEQYPHGEVERRLRRRADVARIGVAVVGPPRDEGVQVAVDSVTSAPDAAAHPLRGSLGPVALGRRYDERRPG